MPPLSIVLRFVLLISIATLVMAGLHYYVYTRLGRHLQLGPAELRLLKYVFIALFVLIFHQRFRVRVLGTGDGKAWAGTAAFVALAALFVAATRGLPPLPLNGSEIYLPPFALLLWCARAARRTQPASARWLTRAAGLFVISLVCRTSDTLLCGIWPVGTHVGWHLVNAGVLYCCLCALLAVSAPPSVPATYHAPRV